LENNTKEKILRVAANLFRKNGFNGTSISDIVRESGVSKMTVYYHFPSKQNMLHEVINRGMGEGTSVKNIANSKLGLKEKLREITKFHVTNMLRHIDFVSASLLERDRLEKQYRSNYIRRRDDYQHRVEEIIKEGIKLGVFPPVKNIKLTTYAIFDICNGPSRWYKPEGALTPEQIAEELSTLICDYLLQIQPGKGSMKTARG
jgi:TetR/AcrR family transcriptional regulator, cholesterol catabolism regulator